MFVLFLKEKVLRRKLYLWTSTLGDFIVICTVLSVNAENRSPQILVVMIVCPVDNSLRFSLLFSDFIYKGIFVIWYWQFHYWQNSVEKLFVTSTLRKMNLRNMEFLDNTDMVNMRLWELVRRHLGEDPVLWEIIQSTYWFSFSSTTSFYAEKRNIAISRKHTKAKSKAQSLYFVSQRPSKNHYNKGNKYK